MTVLTQISDAMQALVEKTASRVVALNPSGRNAASGILWRAGLVVTADEALDDEDSIEVVMPDGGAVTGTLAGRDPSTDIALLRVESRFATLDSFKPAASVKAGHLAVAIGRSGHGALAASGIVKESGESWRSWAGGLVDRRILLDLALDRRAHGGAVVDASGDLIGLAAFGPRHRALVIPGETVGRIAERLAISGSIARGYLGAGLHPLRDQQASGAIVVRLDDNGPAKRAGILVGDVLTAWDGEPIHGVRDVFKRLGPDTVGSTITFDVTRANQQIKVKVAVGERPHK
ncbi:MAG TPA: S1C family serine protease [Xanthobacteraceae bacterium]|nr:S1C family serine protease [Xanthobacteraceae bacterium]